MSTLQTRLNKLESKVMPSNGIRSVAMAIAGSEQTQEAIAEAFAPYGFDTNNPENLVICLTPMRYNGALAEVLPVKVVYLPSKGYL